MRSLNEFDTGSQRLKAPSKGAVFLTIIANPSAGEYMQMSDHRQTALSFSRNAFQLTSGSS